jgi:hypothetical protein
MDLDAYTFRVGAKDRVGCTVIDKHTFKNVLELTHADPIKVKRVSGPEYEVSAIKCTSSGRTYYQLDLSEIGLHVGSTVVLHASDDTPNEIHMAIIEPPHRMWERRGVVDAIADIQRRVDELEAAIWN